MSDKRANKRWKREHGKRSSVVDKVKDVTRRIMGGPWVFHKAQWGDLEVVVLPKTVNVRESAVDSNTGVVVGAPFHAYLRAAVVVNDGSRPDCDVEALNYMIWNDRNKSWRSTGIHAWCIPRRRMEESGKKEVYRMSVDAIMQGRGLTKEQAEAEADMVLGWSPDSIHCGSCNLQLCGLGAKELTDQAREYAWTLALPFTPTSWKCRGCSSPEDPAVPTWDELIVSNPELANE